LRSKRFTRLLAAAIAVAAVPAAAASAASAATLTGAGSTLVAPLEAEWAAGFNAQSGNSVNYAAVGSGTGLKDISAGQVDFGASDAPLSANPVSCSGCSQMPWALSAVGISFHINGLKQLRLTGNVIAEIYLGQIKNWHDRRIQKLQKKGVHLPNLPISVFWRSDGSGTTYAFANYESDVSSSFRSRIGDGVSLQWPVGSGAKGNAGMTQAVQSTNGGIAYVEIAYLIANFPRAAAIQNRAGNYEVPNLSNIASAASSVSSLPSSNEVHIVNPPKRFTSAYPISSYTYVILKNGQHNNALAKQFVQYAVTTGQAFGPRLGFVPIPKFVRNRDLSTLNGVS
jgi:phosphate transport system substrate-binding protein